MRIKGGDQATPRGTPSPDSKAREQPAEEEFQIQDITREEESKEV
jgi:hypothetical protein